jgi:hypothetical protein
MARSEHLPIYKRSYDLCLYLEQVVAGFPRYHKYAIGADLRDGARRVLRGVVRANSAADKAPLLRELRLAIEELKVLCRLACDLKAFSSLRAFEHAVGRHIGAAYPFSLRRFDRIPGRFNRSTQHHLFSFRNRRCCKWHKGDGGGFPLRRRRNSGSDGGAGSR